ncbi:MAG: hypothetical protein K0R00_105 [Herbinix sp.]|jgi:hypothetical protein|nr:hypothetical protein [Herbinix sp.]
MPRQLGELHPCNGGCWFCHNGFSDLKDKAFSYEFDTNLHISCLLDELRENPNNEEAKLIAKEYGIKYNNNELSGEI